MSERTLMAGDVVPANDAEAAILSRRAVRGFLPKPVGRAEVEHILDVAARAPSGTNMQPWRAIALAGGALDEFREALAGAFLAGEASTARDYRYYPDPFFEPYQSRRRKIGWELYGHLGIGRGEKTGAVKRADRRIRPVQAENALEAIDLDDDTPDQPFGLCPVGMMQDHFRRGAKGTAAPADSRRPGACAERAERRTGGRG